jgi:hypothetical protein
MKAWICSAYGDPSVLVLEDRPKPVPGDGGVLIRIEATTVSSGDSRVRALRLPRGFGPIGRLALGFGVPAAKFSERTLPALLRPWARTSPHTAQAMR